MYIVIEGQDATGKDTQAQLLAEYLRNKGKAVTHYAESGTASDDPFISEIARLNYGTTQNIDHRTRTLLFLINRYEQWRRFAEPALKREETVITTRNWFSTLVYEGYGGGVSRNLIVRIHKLVLPERYFKPDKIVILTLSDAERKKRLIAQGKRSSEVFKSMASEFQQKLNRSYLTIAKDYKVPTLDATGTPKEVSQRLIKLFSL